MCHELRTRYALCSHTATVLTRCGLPCQAWPGVYERVEGVSCQAVWCRFNSPPSPRSGSCRLESSVSAIGTDREVTRDRVGSGSIAEWRESGAERRENDGRSASEQQPRRAVRFELSGGGGRGGGGGGRGGGNGLVEEPGGGGGGGGGPRRPGMPGGDDDGDSSSSSDDEENHNLAGYVENESHA